ncbi:MAG: hypothetical protein RLZZ598_589 [Pseudomonadota bacterium]
MPSLQKELGQTVVVENLAGAGGSIGVAKALSSPGSVLVLASQTEAILTPFSKKKPLYESEQLRPVALLTRGVYGLLARPDFPARKLDELARIAQERGSARPLAFGHIGNGSMMHLMGERWVAKTQTAVTMVPYKGVGPLLQDLMGGQVDLAFLPMAGQIADLIASGKLTALASTGAAPTARFPSVQTFGQQDKRLSDLQFETWAAAFVNKATPQPAVNRLHQALTNVMNSTEFRDSVIKGNGEVIEPLSLGQLDAFYQSETRRYRQMSRESGIQPE